MLDQYIYSQPGHLIRRAHQLAWSVFMDETKAFDMTPVQYSLLVAVGEYPSIDATRLSELIDMIAQPSATSWTGWNDAVCWCARLTPTTGARRRYR